MLNKHNETSHTFIIDGVEYRCRPLPVRFQSEPMWVNQLGATVAHKAVVYYASFCGQIISVNKRGDKKVISQNLKPNKDGVNRWGCRLTKDGKTNNHYVHRLVAAAWCTGYRTEDDRGNPRNTVNHIDEDTLNNKATNLHWVSRRENAIHSLYKMPAVRLEQGQMREDEEIFLDIIHDYSRKDIPITGLVEAYGCGLVTQALRIGGFFTMAESASKLLSVQPKTIQQRIAWANPL